MKVTQPEKTFKIKISSHEVLVV